MLAKTLETSIGWTSIQYGYITGAFQATYAIGLLGGGYLMDRLGTRKGYSLAVSVWSLAAIAHAAATSALSFGIAAIIPGTGRSRQFPSLHQDRSRMVSQEGTRAGHRHLQRRHKHWSCRRPAHGALAGSHIWLADGLHRYRRAGFLWLIFWLYFLSPSAKSPAHLRLRTRLYPERSSGS